MPWNAVAVSGSVDIGSGTVNIGSGTVDLAPGTTVQLAAGSTVNIAAGAIVNLGGGQLTNGAGTPVQPVVDQLTSGDLGTGQDGSVTLTVNTTLARDMQYSSLTVNAGVTLTTASYVIRCTGTLTNNGTVANNGGNATTSAVGLGAPTGSLLGGADGVTVPGGTQNTAAGNNAPSADVQGGYGGSTTNTQNPPKVTAGGSVVASGALGLSMSGLRSLRYAGGGSGAVDMYAVANFIGYSGGAAGVIIAICDATAGTGTWKAIGGNPNINANPSGYSYAVGGSGGGTVYIATRTRNDSWTFQVQGSNALHYTGTDGAYTAQNGGPGRSGILVCNG